MEDSILSSPPAKRVKLDENVDTEMKDEERFRKPKILVEGVTPAVASLSEENSKELEVGITAFVKVPHSIFRGVLKQRYTDFLVNEILPDGSVLHLRNLHVKGKARDRRQLQAQDCEPQAGEIIKNGNHQDVKENQGPDPTSTSTSEATSRNNTTSSTSEHPKPKAGHDPQAVLAVGETTGVSDDDRVVLAGFFNEDVADQLISLFQSVLQKPGLKSREYATVSTPFTSDRSLRSKIHQEIRRIFSGKIESSTNADGILVLTAAAFDSRGQNRGGGSSGNQSRSKNRNGKLGWIDRGGEYTHFNMYKENQDTMEVISFMTRHLKTNNKAFQFAGTKDRRAVTVQRVSAYRIEAERLAGINKTLRRAAVGDFEYQPHGLELGELQGNEFLITLRDCKLDPVSSAPQTDVSAIHSYLSTALSSLRTRGFLNYFGLQRFGTFATRTDSIGLLLLQGDFRGAVEAILSFPAAALTPSSEAAVIIGESDRARAEAIYLFNTGGRINDVLDKLPRKFTAEASLVRHLGRNKGDFLGALLSIQRNLRLMYVHAYQSLVWNRAASERWHLYGEKVVEGDIVLVHEHNDKEVSHDKDAVDADGEIIIQPSGDDRGTTRDDAFERGRHLTAEEAASGRYSIFDVVLPLPGWDVVYPANESGVWYKTFMMSQEGGGVDPEDMRRRQKDFSLSGGYRKLLARIGQDFEVNVEIYRDQDGDKQFVQTDLEKLKNAEQGSQPEHAQPDVKVKKGDQDQDQDVDNAVTDIGSGRTQESDEKDVAKVAAVLKFQLGSSQYATMALRELSRGGIQAYKTDFMGSR